MLRAFVVAVATAWLLLLAAPALAHATPEGSTPAAGSVVPHLPAQVTVRFDEMVTLVPGSLTVTAPDGHDVVHGEARHPAGHDEQVVAGLDGPDRAGTYLVQWRIVSDDGHPESGSFTFSVRSTGAVPHAKVERPSRALAAALGLARWLGYLGCAVLFGVSILAGGLRAEPLVRRVALGGGVVLVVGTLLNLLLKGGYDEALGLGAFGRPSLVREVLGTAYGHATLARLVLALLAVVVLALGAGRRGRSTPAALGVVLLLATGVTFALAGHSGTGSAHVVATINDTVHVTAASLWIGAVLLAALALRLDTVRAADGAAGAALARAGVAGPLAVLVLLATGIYQAARQLGSWHALVSTPYGHDLLLKLGVLALVLVLAAFNRARLRRGDLAGRRLGALLAAETLGLAAVLGVASALVVAHPAVSIVHEDDAHHADAGE